MSVRIKYSEYFQSATQIPDPSATDWATFGTFLQILPWKRLNPCNIVELAPALDATDRSAS